VADADIPWIKQQPGQHVSQFRPFVTANQPMITIARVARLTACCEG
jgi:hypothetical protein